MIACTALLDTRDATTGAIIGGIAGAAGGAVLASKTADRDVVVRPGMKVEFTLSSGFTVTR